MSRASFGPNHPSYGSSHPFSLLRPHRRIELVAVDVVSCRVTQRQSGTWGCWDVVTLGIAGIATVGRRNDSHEDTDSGMTLESPSNHAMYPVCAQNYGTIRTQNYGTMPSLLSALRHCVM